MDLRVIIVSYNTCHLLERCLQSLRDYLPAGSHEIVVVDNASTDGSPQMIRDLFPEVRLLAQDTNLGYAAACNLALQGLDVPFALILNSDIELRPDAIAALLAHMAASPRCGMAGPELILPGGQIQVSWGRGFTLRGFIAQQLLLDKLSRPASADASTQPLTVDHLDGACLLVRAEALRQVGLLDEGYWMYCEDSDWALRFRLAGWDLCYVPASSILHVHGASSHSNRAQMIASYNLAAARYFRLHSGPGAGWLARGAGLTGTSLRLLGSALGCLVTLGLVQGLRTRLGLFARALGLQFAWRSRWQAAAHVPALAEGG